MTQQYQHSRYEETGPFTEAQRQLFRDFFHAECDLERALVAGLDAIKQVDRAEIKFELISFYEGIIKTMRDGMN